MITRSLAKAALFETEQAALEAAARYVEDRRTNYGRRGMWCRYTSVEYCGSQGGYVVRVVLPSDRSVFL
jgi:hypothetical protein